MQPEDIQKLRALTSFYALVDYLRDELDWPIEAEDAEEVTFDYDPEELGIDPVHAVKIDTIKQIRPLAEGQPWGIFYIEFETKSLPVVVLRRILRALVPTSRLRDPNRPAWQMSDLLFICSQGEEYNRSLSFAHFSHSQDSKTPELHTFSWDSKETHFYYLKNLYLEALRWPEDESDIDAWQRDWDKAFKVEHRYVIRTAQSLAREMAKMAATIRDLVLEVYDLEHSGGPLHQLHLSFKMVLIHDLTVEDFADMYAQTVTYGLFSARVTQEGDFSIQDVVAMIPNTNPFLKELLEELTTKEAVDLDEIGVGQLVQLLYDVDIKAILRDFGRQRRGEDPVIHFYETFLKEYDADKKVQRGVFYTPDPVVSFIVRSIDHILQAEFDCVDGLADTGMMEWKGQSVPKVQILDPATGTGTFLKYVIQQVWNNFYQRNKNRSAAETKRRWNYYVPKHLLPRMYGFELMMAPYAVAHMKLGLTLKQTGYDFQVDERLRVYLTNSLQPAHEVPRIDRFSLAHEAEEASCVKNDIPITVVIGNPPYSVTSSNQGEYIRDLMKIYKKAVKGEKGLVALSDDYLKFIRLSHFLIDQTGKGVVGLITNRGYISGLIHRGLRQELMKSFDKIFIVDLHGDTNIGERGPDGKVNENVFDIQQGVSIIFLIKALGLNQCDVFFHEFWGTREEKNEILITNDITSINFIKLSPEPDKFFFAPFDKSFLAEYERYYSIRDIFHINSCGVKTHRDGVLIDFARGNLTSRFNDIATSEDLDRLKKQYGIKDTNHWSLQNAKKSIKANEVSEFIHEITYRPFDKRYIYYNRDIIEKGDSKYPTLQHMLRPNKALLASRIQVKDKYNAVFCSELLAEMKTAESTRSSNVFPLYIGVGA